MTPTVKTTFRFTREEADKFLRNLPDRVHFSVRLGGFLQIEGDPDGHGFDISELLSVNRRQARDAAGRMLGTVLQERGGRLRIEWWPSEISDTICGRYLSKGHCFIG